VAVVSLVADIWAHAGVATGNARSAATAKRITKTDVQARACTLNLEGGRAWFTAKRTVSQAIEDKGEKR